MSIRINEELRTYVDPLTANEYAALERSILAEGCRDALVLWGDVLIDGHNRYAICQKHGVEFKTVQNDSFASIEQVMLWMIDNQLARRSVSDFQRGLLALRKKAILAEREKAKEEAQASQEDSTVAAPPAAAPPERSEAVPILTRDDVAKLAGISSNTVSRIEKIHKTAAPELVDAVRAGTISINAAAAVATLPAEQQVAAVAGGKKELQQVAKQVREAKAPPKPERMHAAMERQAETSSAATSSPSEVAMLRTRVEELDAENATLKAQIVALTAALEEAKRAV